MSRGKHRSSILPEVQWKIMACSVQFSKGKLECQMPLIPSLCWKVGAQFSSAFSQVQFPPLLLLHLRPPPLSLRIWTPVWATEDKAERVMWALSNPPNPAPAGRRIPHLQILHSHKSWVLSKLTCFEEIRPSLENRVFLLFTAAEGRLPGLQFWTSTPWRKSLGGTCW